MVAQERLFQAGREKAERRQWSWVPSKSFERQRSTSDYVKSHLHVTLFQQKTYFHKVKVSDCQKSSTFDFSM